MDVDLCSTRKIWADFPIIAQLCDELEAVERERDKLRSLLAVLLVMRPASETVIETSQAARARAAVDEM